MCIRDRLQAVTSQITELKMKFDQKDYKSVNAAAPALLTQAVSYTHLRAHETPEHLVCRLLLEKKKRTPSSNHRDLLSE